MTQATRNVDVVGATTMPTGLYDRDFVEWALREAGLIRGGRLGELDLENLAEEIESLGKEQFSKIRSAFRIILLHMLKWDHQPERRSKSWAVSIRNARWVVADVVGDSPSLRRRREEAIAVVYRQAREEAAGETGLSLTSFPTECPYGLDDILTRPFRWPED